MNNEWNHPEGYEERPNPIRYRILKDGAPVEHLTQQAIDPITRRWHHSLNASDHEVSISIRRLIQQACGYFYLPDDKYEPLVGVPEIVVSDDDVRERIDRMNRGENMREAVRVRKEQYHFDRLPWDQQRALVEQIEALKRSLGFEWLGESPVPAPSPLSQMSGTIADEELYEYVEYNGAYPA